jgi:hypothetical protein
MREMMISTTSVSHTRRSFMATSIHFIGELLDDDEQVPDDETEITSRAGFASVEAQDLEDEAVRIVARAGHDARPSYTKFGDLPLPFRVLRSTDPTIWSVRVKVGILHYV